MIKIHDIAYVRYGVTDVDATERFFQDFGLITVSRNASSLMMRAAGPRPYCYIAQKAERPGIMSIGLETLDSLEPLSRLEGASAVESIDGPGGGQRVRLTSPGGFVYEVVSGIAPAPALDFRPALTLNPGSSKPRQNATQRPPKGAAEILKLGHCALISPDPMAEIDWICKTFGFLISDYLIDPESKAPIAAFLRMNQGQVCTDHHTLAIFPGEKTDIHHCSFEVEDLDALWLGNQHLARGGHTHHWGIGRHILGSQLFDYWFDPDGNRIEHYTDGDVMNESHVAGALEATDDALALWAPETPAGFIG